MRHISGIGDIADGYDAFILDIYGVLHDGVAVFPGTIDCLERLKIKGIKTCLVSNAPWRNAETSAGLENIGISHDLYTGIMTGGESAWRGLERYRGQKLWHLGEAENIFTAAALRNSFDISLTRSLDDAEIFANDYFRVEGTPDDGLRALLETAARRGLTMICTNPDLVVDLGQERYLCPGYAAKLYEDMGGPVDYHGKPHRPVYEAARDALGGIALSRLCAVGDSLHTDIQGANKFGIDSVLALSGIHGREINTGDRAAISGLIDSQPHKPTYVTKELKW